MPFRRFIRSRSGKTRAKRDTTRGDSANTKTKITEAGSTTSAREWRRVWGPRIRSYGLRYGLPFGALLAIIVTGSVVAFREVRNLPEFQIYADQLRIENQPDWLSPGTAWKINQKTFLALRRTFGKTELSVFEPNLLEPIHRIYEQDPWVQSVEGVSKHFPNLIKVRLVLRRPRVQVRDGEHTFLIDPDGWVLDRFVAQVPAPYQRLPDVRGLKVPAGLSPGRWDDVGLRTALDVLASLDQAGLLEPLRLAAVDVSNLGGRISPKESDLVLIRWNSVRIFWGRTTGAYSELPVEKKMDKIAALLKEAGDIADVDWNVRFTNGGIIERSGANPTSVSTAKGGHPKR